MGIKPRDLLGGNALFKVKTEGGQKFLYSTRYMDWHFQKPQRLVQYTRRFHHTNRYGHCDVVESTSVGAQKHSLLRKVELERRGQDRATIEPLHREWIRVRSPRVEIVEVSLTTPRGNLLVLPAGKTLITLGFRRV